MPVVINEFEIVPEPGPTPRADGRPKAPTKDVPEEDSSVERALRRTRERSERVRAH